jgi:cold shock CspA family protein
LREPERGAGINQMKEAEVKELIEPSSITSTNTRLKGTIIHINPKGFGFINSKDKPFTRIFFHWQSLHHTINIRELKTGDKVSFELRQNEDSSWRAIKVDLI